MGRVVFGSWIPRSYLHVYEVSRKIGKIPLNAGNVELKEGISFDFMLDRKKVSFKLDGNGLYTLSTSKAGPSEDWVKNFGNKMREVLLEKIIKNCHSVTYKQIKDGAVPLSWCVVSVSGKQSVFEKIKPYEVGEAYYVKSCSKNALKGFLQLLLFNQFLYSMMDKMEELYHNSDSVAGLLEKAIELGELRKVVLQMDLIVKDVVESNARLRQSRIIFDRFCSYFSQQRFSSSDNKVLKTLGAFRIHNQLVADFAYIEELWQLLLDFLEKIDNAAEARFSYQESLESTRIESLLSIEVASSLAPIIFSIFLTETYGVGGVVLSFGVFAVWLLIVYFIRRIRGKSVKGRFKKVLRK
jgi:hypothetical protein